MDFINAIAAVVKLVSADIAARSAQSHGQDWRAVQAWRQGQELEARFFVLRPAEHKLQYYSKSGGGESRISGSAPRPTMRAATCRKSWW